VNKQRTCVKLSARTTACRGVRAPSSSPAVDGFPPRRDMLAADWCSLPWQRPSHTHAASRGGSTRFPGVGDVARASLCDAHRKIMRDVHRREE
jgi:hypothetical protein